MYRPVDERQLQLRFAARALIFLSALSTSFLAAGAHSLYAQDRTVEQYSCKDVMRESGPNRDVAIAFLHGFLLGKSGASKFNVDDLHKQSDQFIEACLEKPSDKAIDVMSTAKK